MALVSKISPVGVDVFIDKLQKTLFDNLTIPTPSWTEYESFHRAYKNPSLDKTIPEIFTADGEYKEVLFNDKFNVTSFFLVDDSRDRENQVFIQTVSVIFQAKLNKLYPSIIHRADEEMIIDILNVIENFPAARDISVATGVNNVYSELTLANMADFDDMSEFHVVKIDMEARYIICSDGTTSIN